MSDASLPSESSESASATSSEIVPAPGAPAGLAETADRSEAAELASELSPPQQQVLQQLARGVGIIQAAKVTGINRRTVSRWVNDDAQFIAAYNAWKLEQLESGRASAVAMTDVVMSAIRKGIEQGDTAIAFRVARELGVLGAVQPSLTDATEIQRRRALREKRREERLRRAEVRHGLRIEEKLEKDGITWTNEGERRLSREESLILHFLREKMSGREERSCAHFSPLDGQRQLCRWERARLVEARASMVEGGQFTFQNGAPVPLRKDRNHRNIYRSKREMFDRLVADGMDKDEAMRVLANYKRPFPGFFEANDLPYAEDAAPAAPDQPADATQAPAPNPDDPAPCLKVESRAVEQ